MWIERWWDQNRGGERRGGTAERTAETDSRKTTQPWGSGLNPKLKSSESVTSSGMLTQFPPPFLLPQLCWEGRKKLQNKTNSNSKFHTVHAEAAIFNHDRARWQRWSELAAGCTWRTGATQFGCIFLCVLWNQQDIIQNNLKLQI